MSNTSVDNLIEAINEPDASRARELIEEVGDEYDELSVEEEKRVRQAILLRGDDSLSEAEDEQLEQLISSSTKAEVKRGAFLLRAATAVLKIEQDSEPDDTINEAVTELKQADEDLEQQKENTEQVIQESKISPSIELIKAKLDTSTIPVERSTQLIVTVANVGDESAKSVELTIETNNGLTIAKSSETLDSISGGGSQTRTYEVNGDDTGEQQIRVDVSSKNAGSDANSVTLSVEEANEPSVEDYVNQDGLVRLTGLREAIADWRESTVSDELLQEVTAAWRAQETVI